jgi:23S rRNA pseudouridine2604 synthase
MCEYVGYEVIKLERVRIMNISLKGLPVGDWRDLNPTELAEIYDSIKDSSSEHQAKKSPPNTSKNPEKKAKPAPSKPTRNNPDKRKKKSGHNPSAGKSTSKRKFR